MSLFHSNKEPNQAQKSKSLVLSTVILLLVISPLTLAVGIYTHNAYELEHKSADSAQAAPTATACAPTYDNVLDNLLNSSRLRVHRVGEKECLIKTESLGDVRVVAENKNGLATAKIEFEYKLTDINSFDGKTDPYAIHMQEVLEREIADKGEDFAGVIAEVVLSMSKCEITYSEMMSLDELLKLAYDGKMAQTTLYDEKGQAVSISVARYGDTMRVAVETMNNR